jgi:hypothetical protein
LSGSLPVCPIRCGKAAHTSQILGLKCLERCYSAARTAQNTQTQSGLHHQWRSYENRIIFQTTRKRVRRGRLAGSIEDQAREAGFLASGLPYQYLTEAVALKVCIRDLEMRKLVDLVYRWSTRPGLVSIAAQRGAVAA